VRRMTYTRRQGGEPIRAAMDGLTLKGVAAATRKIDPAGRGISYQLISFLRARPEVRSARETTSARTVWLLSGALGVPEDALFDAPATATPNGSAREREPAHAT